MFPLGMGDIMEPTPNTKNILKITTNRLKNKKVG
jgi:hypothetical protein